MVIKVTKEDVLKHLQFILIIVIFGLLLWSQPWKTAGEGALTRTIQVSGEATIEAVPDEFTFNPYFEETGSDQEALLNSLTEKANEAITKLKELGVQENDLEIDANSYERWYWDENSEEEQTGVLYLRVKVSDKELAQQVQDYLLTLDIKGQLTPQAVFSKSKQKELDAQAVEQASNDARSKAEAQANLFGAKLGKVVKVQQGSDTVFPVAFDSRAAIAEDISLESPSLPVLPGENEYSQTVTVTYELK